MAQVLLDCIVYLAARWAKRFVARPLTLSLVNVKPHSFVTGCSAILPFCPVVWPPSPCPAKRQVSPPQLFRQSDLVNVQLVFEDAAAAPIFGELPPRDFTPSAASGYTTLQYVYM